MKEKKYIKNQKPMTTAAGAPVANNQDSMTAGPRGPMVLQDVWYLEKMAHFDREVIPERRMHAKGSGAFGTFTLSHHIPYHTNLYSANNMLAVFRPKTQELIDSVHSHFVFPQKKQSETNSNCLF